MIILGLGDRETNTQSQSTVDSSGLFRRNVCETFKKQVKIINIRIIKGKEGMEGRSQGGRESGAQPEEATH